MSVSKQQILPKSMIDRFCRSFSIHDLLIHLHSLSKMTKFLQSSSNYNLGTFLTMDKSRKIIRQKEESLFVEIMKKISDQYTQLISKESVDDSQLFKISYSELEKFIELFYAKKRLFEFVKNVVNNVEIGCGINERDVMMNYEGLRKMQNKLQELQQKLIKVIHKYEQRTNVTFEQKLNYHSKINETDHHQQIKPSQVTCLDANPLSIVRRNPKKKQTIINKIGQNSSDQSRIDNYKSQIAELKSKYYRLNCKTDIQQVVDRKQIKDNLILRTQPNEQVQKNHETVAAEDMKFSIRLTRDKKNTKVSASSSIFDKSTNNASYFVRTSTNPTIDRDPTNSRTNCQQRFSLKNQSSFLKKKSFVNYKSPVNCDDTKKKGSNTVYCPSGFSADSSKKRRSVQKRNTMINGREIMSATDNLKRKTCFVVMRTEADIVKQQNLQEDFMMNFREQLTYPEILNQQRSKTIKNIEAQQDRIEGVDMDGDEENKENINNSQINEDQQEIILHNYQNKKSSKSKNRRKGFSKKHIDVSQDSSMHQIPSQTDTHQSSGIWDQSDIRQRTYKRTSIFRTSGYLQKNSNKKKARFNNSCNKKLVHRDSSMINQIQRNSQTMENVETQRIAKERASIPHQTRKYITKQFSVNAKDCASLHQAITGQSRTDQQSVYPFELENMMRKKYDLDFKLQEDDDDYDTNPAKLMSRMRMRVIETDTTEGHKKSRWNEQCDNYGEIDFSKIVLRKINQLGQKNMDNKRNSLLEDQMKVVDL